MISDQAVREYLVMPDFLEESLKKKCGLDWWNRILFCACFGSIRIISDLQIANGPIRSETSIWP